MKTFGLEKRCFMLVATTVLLSLLIGSLVALTVGLYEQPPPNGGSPPERAKRSLDESQVHQRAARVGKRAVESEYRTYRYSAVTSETNVCSQIGTDILGRQLGSAVDAAIASFLCNCLVNAHSCGIGGGHFMTIYEKPYGLENRVVTTVTARERAPQAAHRDMFVNTTGSSSVGGLAVGVPGEIHGFYQAWRTYGRMPWKDLFTESIRMCEEGYIVEPNLASAILQYNTSIRNDPNLAELFVKPDGSLIQTGDLLVNPKLGTTLRRIADDPMTFYTGDLARDIVADLAEYDSIITLEDLAYYQRQPVFKVPLSVGLQNGEYTLHNPSPPSSGVVLSFIMNVLDGYKFSPEDIADDASRTLTYHRIIEAFKFAYGKRSALGDEMFVNITDLLNNMTSKDFAEGIRQKIDDAMTHDVNYYEPAFEIEDDAGTSHLNVLAPDGGAVAITGTVNLFFGAKVRGRRTGIIFNDDMDDFSTPGTDNAFGVPASPSNYIVPGKIPMSSMAPTLVQDKDGRIVFMSGAAGGTRITTATAFVAMQSLWFERDLLESSDTARIHHQLMPNEVVYENWLQPNVLSGLEEKQHETVSSTSIAVCGSIRNHCPLIRSGSGSKIKLRTSEVAECIEAVSDGRKGGHPDGF